MTSVPLVVTAHLDAQAAGMCARPVMLDGPLAWAAAMAAQAGGITLDPITPTHCQDMDLPLARWEEAGTWGWCTSQATIQILHHGSTEIRRRPPTGPMSRYTPERRHHLGLGPHKSRDSILPVEWVATAAWHILTTDQDRLETLLASVTHLGARRGIGMGRVDHWRVEPSHTPDAWRDRPMPTPGTTRAYRAPYWHPARVVETPA